MAEKLLDVERDDGDLVGLTVDSALVVTKVVPSSIADGSIQVGDVIMTINEGRVRDRDDYYHKDSKEPGVAEVIVAKQRNGPTGTVKLAFLRPLTRFESLSAG